MVSVSEYLLYLTILGLTVSRRFAQIKKKMAKSMPETRYVHERGHVVLAEERAMAPWTDCTEARASDVVSGSLGFLFQSSGKEVRSYAQGLCTQSTKHEARHRRHSRHTDVGA
jgi:hypothetical protein